MMVKAAESPPLSLLVFSMNQMCVAAAVELGNPDATPGVENYSVTRVATVKVGNTSHSIDSIPKNKPIL
jgi:hypothetical protein